MGESLDQIRPSFVLKASRFAEWQRGGKAGAEALQAAFHEVVVDLVDKHAIVEPDLRHALIHWLNHCVSGFFVARSAYDRILTDTKLRASQRRITKLGNQLRDELARVYGLEVPDTEADAFVQQDSDNKQAVDDIVDLIRIVSRATVDSPLARPIWPLRTAKDNASNRALDQLSDDICWFWVTGWTSRLDKPVIATAPPISVASNYFQFARYIYTFADQCCGDRGTIERLKDASNRFSQRDTQCFSLFRIWGLGELEKLSKEASHRDVALGYGRG